MLIHATTWMNLENIMVSERSLSGQTYWDREVDEWLLGNRGRGNGE